MLKTKSRVALVAFLVFSLLAVYFQLNVISRVEAASLTNAKVTLSDSDLSATATSTVQFTIGVALYENEYAQVVYPSQFSLTGASVTCPSNMTASSTGQIVECVVDAGQTIATSSALTITMKNVVNPSSAGSYTINIYTRESDGTEKESSNVKVYIIDDVTVTASVDASLTFTVSGVDSGTVINGVTTTGSSTATSLAFGTLNTSASSTLGQQLTVSTNATNGYVVTVQQDQELTSAAGANINSFNNSPDGTGSTTPVAWEAPRGELDNTYTYGHMGLTTDDSDSGLGFDGSKYAGLNSTDPMTIMKHNGPADGSTQNKGLAKVAYTIEITDLQEAGDYQNTLTYICTPTY